MDNFKKCHKFGVNLHEKVLKNILWHKFISVNQAKLMKMMRTTKFVTSSYMRKWHIQILSPSMIFFKSVSFDCMVNRCLTPNFWSILAKSWFVASFDIQLKGEFAVVPTAKICGRSLSAKIPLIWILMKLYVTWPTWPKSHTSEIWSDVCML